MKTLTGSWLMIMLCAALVACGQTEGTAGGGSESPSLQLDASKVPEDLRSLVPLAERWGIGDDVDRNAKVDKATDAERAELKNASEPVSTRSTGGRDAFPCRAMTDGDAA